MLELINKVLGIDLLTFTDEYATVLVLVLFMFLSLDFLIQLLLMFFKKLFGV